MAATVTLANSSANRLLYKVVHTAGEANTIANATLVTDAQGAVAALANASVNGFGTIAPATVLNQAQARSLFLNDGSLGKPQARTSVISRSGGAAWDVDANVDGGGLPTLTVTSSAAGTAYVEVDIESAIG